MPSIAQLKAESDALLGQMKEYVTNNRETGKFYDQDDRAWHLGTNQAKNGAAKIRLLPNAEGDRTNLEVIPAARYYSHSFQAKGGWYIENSLRSVNKPDPVDDYIKWLKANTDEEIENHLFRRTRYVVNIYVYEDMVDPNNNGKHFLWHMPRTLYLMAEDMISPPKAETDKLVGPRDPVNVFDLFKGCDFVVGRIEKNNWTNYTDNSQFLASSPISLVPGNEQANDEAVVDLYQRLYPMSEFIDPSNAKFYKNYDQLFERLQTALAKDLGFIRDDRPAQAAVPTPVPEAVVAQPSPPRPTDPTHSASGQKGDVHAQTTPDPAAAALAQAANPQPSPTTAPPAEEKKAENPLDFFQNLANDD